MTTRKKLYAIVFGTNTKAGRRFDIVLLWFILISVFIVMMESIPAIRYQYVKPLFTIEWFFTIAFSLEYLLRVLVSPRPVRYIFSFWGVVDLVAILPSYLSLVFPGYHYFVIIRMIRFLRVFRVYKLARYIQESQALVTMLRSSFYKINIFLLSVFTLVTLMGTLMYVVEGKAEGFNSIPQSIYWAIVTITTVGYGDVVPQSVVGKFISSIMMIVGYAIIAVPTGIFSAEITRLNMRTKKCHGCHHDNSIGAKFCMNCGHHLLHH
jgi:voltage-gated potassium channel